MARELIRTAVGKVYNEYFEGVNFSQVVKWFDLGGSLKLDEARRFRHHGAATGRDTGADGEDAGARADGATSRTRVRAAAAEFILEGLYAHRRISRNEERGFSGEEKPPRRDPRELQREAGEEGKGERPNFRRGYN